MRSEYIKPLRFVNSLLLESPYTSQKSVGNEASAFGLSVLFAGQARLAVDEDFGGDKVGIEHHEVGGEAGFNFTEIWKS